MPERVNMYDRIPMQAQYPSQIQNQTGQQPVMQGDFAAHTENITGTVGGVVGDSYIAKKTSHEDNLFAPENLYFGVPLGILIGIGMDKYSKAHRGNYINTPSYRLGNFGDRVNNFITQKVLGKKATEASYNWLCGAKDWVNNNIIDNVKVLKALRDTPSKAEFRMARMMGSVVAQQTMDYKMVTDGFIGVQKCVKDLDCYGKHPKWNEFVTEWTGKLKGVTDKKAYDTVMRDAELAMLKETAPKHVSYVDKMFKAASPEEKLQHIKARCAGYRNYKHYQMVVADDVLKNNSKYIINACKKANKDVFARSSYSEAGGLFDTLKKWFVGRKVYFSETGNKLIGSASDISPHKTVLGRWLPKLRNWVLECLTNSVGGGKIAAILAGVVIMPSIMATWRAEKGDKIKTFGERSMWEATIMICMALGIGTFHRFGGIQYAGMDKKGLEIALENVKKIKNSTHRAEAEKILKRIISETTGPKGKTPVEAYRTILKQFNTDVLKGAAASGYATKEAHTGAVKGIKAALNAGVTKNPLTWGTWLFKKGASLITSGLETIEPFRKTAYGRPASFWPQVGQSLKTLDIFKHPRHYLKKLTGVPLRFALVGFVLAQAFQRIFVSVPHAILGKPKNSYFGNNNKEEAKAQAAQANAEQAATQQEILARQQLVAQAREAQRQERINSYPANYEKPEVYASSTNLINQVKQRGNALAQTQQTQQSNINKETGVKKAEPIRTYVPSPTPVQLLPENIDPATAAMQRTDRAEKLAIQTLAMK